MFVINRGDVVLLLHHGSKICRSQQKEVLQITSRKKNPKNGHYDFPVHDCYNRNKTVAHTFILDIIYEIQCMSILVKKDC